MAVIATFPLVFWQFACVWHSKHDARQCFPKDLTRRMGQKRADVRFFTTLSLVLVACSSAPPPSARDVVDANDTGGALTAASASERQLLKEVPKLPAGAAWRVGNALVVSEAMYAAASGRTCRALHVTAGTGKTSHRLACSDGKAWFFVPDVFGSNGARD